MKPNDSPQEKTALSLKGKTIWIVGPRRLQNELLGDLLVKKTGVSCLCGETVTQVIPTGDEKSRPGLFLFDCLDEDLEGCLRRVGQDEQILLPSYLAALFNVKPGLELEERALKQGIRGFFYEKDPPELLQKGVRTIFAGQLWVSREIMSKCILENRGNGRPHPGNPEILTAREMEILSLIAMGATNEEIGTRLCISVNTVKTHIYNIFHKIKVPNRLQAALWAARHL